MENYLEVLIFLAFAAFSLLSQWLERKRKAAKQAAPRTEEEADLERSPTDAPPVTASPADRPQPTTGFPDFEQMLRELTGQPPASKPEENYEDDYELPPYLQEQQEPPPTTTRTPTKIADKISLKSTGKRIEPVKLAKKSKKKTSLGASIGRSLRQPDTAKRAVILSEILQRKHF